MAIAVPALEWMCLLPCQLFIPWPFLTFFVMVLEALLLTEGLITPSTG